MDNNNRISSKITRILFLSQSIVSAAIITTATVSSIAGAELSGVTVWAGLPTTFFLFASAIGALIWGFLMERFGRRTGMTVGLILGAVGGFTAGSAIWKVSFPGFLAGMALLGLANSVMLLGRFAAAEVNPVEKRGQAIANVVLGGTIGAIAGPLLVGPAGDLALRLGFNELAGPFGTAMILLVISAGGIFIWLRPDPMEIARELASKSQVDELNTGTPRSVIEILTRPGVRVAILTMVTGQAVMVMVMVITGLHMKALTHPLSSISFVISAHTFGMYAFSVLSGRLADRIGRGKVIIIGSSILILAGLTAGLSPNVFPLAISLFLLGLGWNMCYVGGSTLLTDQLSPSEQSRMQGVNDLFVGLASAIGSLGSGFVFAAVGFQIMGYVGGAVAIIPLSVAYWWMRKPKLELQPSK